MKAWHPDTETEATSALCVLIEWLRATAIRPDADPATIRAWRATDPASLHATIGQFLGLDRTRTPADAVLRARPDQPNEIKAALQTLTWPDLLAAVTAHVLDANTRPDDRILWTGTPTAYALATLAMGATLVLVEAPTPPP